MSVCRAPQSLGCSGAVYDSGFFREFFRIVESCFWIVSGMSPPVDRGLPGGQKPMRNAPFDRARRTIGLDDGVRAVAGL